MLELAKALTSIQQETLAGCYIGRAVYQIFNRHTENTLIRANVVRSSRRFIIAEAVKESKEGISEKLTIYLLPPNENALPEDPRLTNGRFWHYFTNQEVYQFSHLIDDTNPIHLTGRPVVQGLLLLSHLLPEFPEGTEYHARFLAPSYAGESLYLEKGSGWAVVYTSKKRCLHLSVT